MMGAMPSAGKTPEVTSAPSIGSASALPDRVTSCPWRNRPIADRPRARSCQSKKLGSAIDDRPRSFPSRRNTTRDWSSVYGIGASSTPSTTVNIAAVPPIPTASVSTTARLNPGARRICRNA